MQAVRNHIQVIAMYNRSPPALAPDCHDPAARARNGDYSASQRIILACYVTYYEYAAEPYRTISKPVICAIVSIIIQSSSPGSKESIWASKYCMLSSLCMAFESLNGLYAW